MKKLLLTITCLIAVGLFADSESRRANKKRCQCHKAGKGYYSTPSDPVGQCLKKGLLGTTKSSSNQTKSSRGEFVGGVY